MRAYKGFNKNLTSIMGDGNKKNCVFVPGETKEVDKSKTARSGFHCCENPFECLRYYSLDGENRFFIVEAAGDIDEDDLGRIACTRITLVEEMTPLRFTMEGMKYIIEHPKRDRWEYSQFGGKVAIGKAEAVYEGHIAIARGEHPMVRGKAGSILGLLLERDGKIVSCKLFVAGKEQAGKWYTVDEERKLLEVPDEKESN